MKCAHYGSHGATKAPWLLQLIISRRQPMMVLLVVVVNQEEIPRPKLRHHQLRATSTSYRNLLQQLFLLLLLKTSSSKSHILARTKITKQMATIETFCLASSSKGAINSTDKRKRTLRYLSKTNFKTPMSCWSWTSWACRSTSRWSRNLRGLVASPSLTSTMTILTLSKLDGLSPFPTIHYLHSSFNLNSLYKAQLT